MSKKLPSVTSDIPRDLRTFIDRLRELIAGGGNDRLLTANEVVALGIAEDVNGKLVQPGTVLVTPPEPHNVIATAAIQNIIITWDEPRYAGHSYAEIWVSTTNNIGTAVKLGTSPGAIYTHSVGPSSTRYYWVRFVSTSNVAGRYNAFGGTVATTGADADYLLTTLSNKLTTSQLSTSLNSRINLIDANASVSGSVANRIAQVQGQIDAIGGGYAAYVSTTTYAANDIVTFENGIYQAKSTTVDHPPTDTTYWTRIGDYTSLGDAVAAHTTQINNLEGDLGQEIIDRTTLATQFRGEYNGNDLAQLTSGLLFQERTSRSTADTAMAADITVLQSTVNNPDTGLAKTRATLINDYYTAATTDSAIANSANYLRAYANLNSKTFRSATAPTSRGADPQTAATIPLQIGDVWIETDNKNKVWQWNGSAWADSRDGAIADVDARVTTVETTKIGYCTIGGATSDQVDKDTCVAAGGVWHVGLPLATAVKQVSVSDGANSIALEQRFTAQKTVNDGLLAQYTVKLDSNGYVSGFGLANTLGNSTPTTEFVVSANRFAVIAPMSIGPTAPETPFDGQYWRNSTTSVVKRWNAKLATPAWETRDYKLPFAVLTTSQTINGVSFAPGVYIDGATIVQATVGNAQIANLAVDNAKIVDLGASKLLTGSLSVGTDISSSNYVAGTQGWKIGGNGFAEFGAAVIRGTLTASQIDSRGLTIKAADGTAILTAGASLAASSFGGNVSGSVNGTAVADITSGITNAQSTANTANSAAATAQGTANTANAAAAAAQGTANTANAAASAAQSSANTANAALADIASDSVLTPGEKPIAIKEYAILSNEQAGIDAQATSLSITTEKVAYDSAVFALTSYLNTLTSPVAWNNLSDKTTIVGTTFRSKFQDVYSTRQVLLNSIYAANKALANAASAAAADAQAAANAAAAAVDSKLAKSGSQILTGPVTLNAASAITVGTPALNGASGANGFYIGSTGIVGTQNGYATFTLDNGGNATFKGDLTGATGTFNGSLSVGSSPTISGTTMSGSGARINSNGTFAIGNSTANITFTGGAMRLNGNVVDIENLIPGAALPNYVRTYKGSVSPTVNVGSLSSNNAWGPLAMDATALNNKLGATDVDEYRTLFPAGTYFYELSVPVKNNTSDTNDATYTALVVNPPGGPGGYYTTQWQWDGEQYVEVQVYVSNPYTVISTAGVNVVGDWQTATIFGVGRFTLASPTYISPAVMTTESNSMNVVARSGFCTLIWRVWRAN